MALDLYVGTMTRFYRREWENVVQRQAREQGVKYNIIHANGEPPAPAPANEIREIVTLWCRRLSHDLVQDGFAPVSWDESDDKSYFTDRPGFDGYAALLIWAAHLEHPDLPLPQELPRTWTDDAAYRRSFVPTFASRCPHLLRAALWLPSDISIVFEAPTPDSDERSVIGSVFKLNEELESLSIEMKQQSTPKDIAPPAKKTGLLRRLLGKPQSEMKSGLALIENARWGLETFRSLLCFSRLECTNRPAGEPAVRYW
ncbi:MAG: hypothetical protein HYR83_04450 [Planctomycetes bacterium]|nr:hypothetical protein [Planctomycetota bacterium]